MTGMSIGRVPQALPWTPNELSVYFTVIMHQEHILPWNTLTSHFRFIRDNPQITPHRTGFFALNKPRQTQDLNHFVRVLSQTITTFAQTERKKHPETFAAPSTGQLFSDTLRDHHSQFLDAEIQRLEFWIASAQGPTSPFNHTMDGLRFGDVTKVLLREGKLQTLLMLANHPEIPLERIATLQIAYAHIGFSEVASCALLSYVFLNFAAAAGMLKKGGYERWGCVDVEFTLSNLHIPCETSHPPDDVVFQFFLSTSEWGLFQDGARDLHQYHDYVKELFRILYQYDALMRECHLDPQWEQKILYALHRITYGLKLDQQEWLEGWKVVLV
ncbi:hypothetical protein FPV67DRAFT_1505346 [Lyophyllum atratum]|nr:hypothetical protein FPV67DRAFT_1505346 [Lyophyllum atratum]